MAQRLSLLVLPLEIRMLVYDLVLEPDTFNFVDSSYALSDLRPSPMQNIKAFNIVVIGTAPHGKQADIQRLTRQQHDPWILARICHQIRHETTWKLRAVSLDNTFFSFYGFTPDDMSAWIERVGADAISKIRCLGIDGVNWCHDWYRWTYRNPRDWELATSCLRLHRAPHREQVQCYRAVFVSIGATNAGFEEFDTLVRLRSHTSDERVDCYCDHRTGAVNTVAHIHQELVGVQCDLELLQGCLDAREQFTVRNDSSSARGPVPMVTIDGLMTLAMTIRGREYYDDERLLTKFPRRGSCERLRGT